MLVVAGLRCYMCDRHHNQWGGEAWAKQRLQNALVLYSRDSYSYTPPPATTGAAARTVHTRAQQQQQVPTAAAYQPVARPSLRARVRLVRAEINLQA